ncbi:haloalkane dehalogenase [Arcticibacterium luteifluviistationis]|uniref:Haloalkane dehalogenase n=1 Tax=Arcticibacterium luteifluviistationis TaxID=1784714 RepID=A0A2Z4G6C9_9BACT|nr:haloalkane dehalogenase [Arcticibacterium luteifluviistationis]AWV96699.1 haloalkane dehalogenase [Arcticibacterium luteifluviistationis]
MEIIKTPKSAFEQITDYPFKENYVDFDGIKMHYIDEGKGETILALHGQPTWSYLYRKFIPHLKDHRFIAPDLIGFGKSDKIVGSENYSYDLHFKSLKNFIDKLDLNDITLIVQDWGGLLGLGLLGQFPERFKRVVILNTFLPIGKPANFGFKLWQWFAKYHPSIPTGGVVQFASASKLSKEVVAAYDAPFPSKKYKGGAKSFPALVPTHPSHDGVKEMKAAREVLSKWNKPALVLFSDKDKVFSGAEKFFYQLIPTVKDDEKIIIKNAGHFLQEEKGKEIAQYIDKFMKGKKLID